MNRLLAAILLAFCLPVAAQDDAAPAPVEDPAAPETAAPQSVETIAVEVDAPAPAPAPALTEPEGPRQLDEIVVTAQKTTQSLQQVPLSVTAISQEQIRYTGSNDLADLSVYVPNVRVDADDLGSPQIFIRGFGTNTFNPSFESSVGFVQDEIVFGRAGYFTEAMFDVDRIEVLRGPQGTLFGKNTIAGVFSVTSATPKDEPGGNLEVKGGSHGEKKAEGGFDLPFGDWGGARVSGLWRDEEGELYNSFLDRSEEELRQRAGRVKLRLTPSPYLVSELTVVDSQSNIPFWPFQLIVMDDDTRDYLQEFDPQVEDRPDDFRTSMDTPGWLQKGSTTAGLKTDWSIPVLGGLEDFHSILVLGASRFYIDQLNELDVSPSDIARLDNHEDHHQLSAELRFNGRAGSMFGLGDSVEFVAGGFWFKSNYVLLARVLGGQDLGSYFTTCDFRQLAARDEQACGPAFPLVLPPAVLGAIGGAAIGEDYYQFDYEQDIESTALFGQLTWNLTEHWALTPGLRFNRESKLVHAQGHSQCPGRETGRPCVMEGVLTANDYDQPGLQRSETDVSPKLVLQYFTDGNTNFYASYTRGFKSGGFNSISFTGDKPADPVMMTPEVKLEYEPEQAQTTELGMKGRFFGKTLRFNVTLYGTKFDNLQVLAFSGLFPVVSNAAAATSRGLEADLAWNTPLDWLSVNAALGLLDAEYDSYPGAPAPIRNPETGALQIGATQDLSGRRIAFAPSSTATITPVVSFPVGPLLLQASADAIYQGSQYVDTDLDPNTYVPGHWKYAARVVLGSAAETWSLVVGGANLTDVRVLNQVTDALFFPGTYYAQAAAGRSLFATLGFRF